MADRLNNYPRLSSHFNSNVLQQQQLPQQSQQHSQGDPHLLQSIPNPERNRMWPAVQQQYRGQNGGEMTGSQGNTQIPDLLRNQNLARAQSQMGQQQQQQLQQHQQFGLASSQITAAAQHPSFHDQQSGQHNQPQLPPNFGNVGMPNPAQLQANMNTRPSLPTLSSDAMRQIELMGLAQNQQHQNPQIGPPSFVTRMAQQQQQQQASMNGQSGPNQGQALFGSQPADVNRGSSSHPPQISGSMTLPQGIMQPNAQELPAGRRPMTFQELKDYAIYLRNLIQNQESTARTFNNNRASMESGVFRHQMGQLLNEIKTKKDILLKVMHAMTALAPQAQTNTNLNASQGGNPGHMPSIGSSPISQHQQASPNGASQSSWLPQAGSAPSPGFQLRGVPQLPSRGPSQPQNPQAVPQTHTPNQISLVTSRPGSTSRQVPAQVSPSLSNQFHGNHSTTQTTNFAQLLPPPLDKAKFQESYTAFCSGRSIVYDERLMAVDNRPIDLHALHYNVLSEGGATKVTQRDLWPVIGAKMGFVQFPGTDTEPAKSGPGVAQQLQHLHKEYLSQFDQIYVHSFLQKKGVFNSLANSAGTSQVNNNLTVGTSSGNMQGTGQQINAVMPYAYTSAADLRARGIPEGVITFVEQNRPYLQRTLMQQQKFRGVMQKSNAQGQTSEQERLASNVPGSSNISSQQQQIIPSGGARPQPPSSQQVYPQPGVNLSGAGHGQPQSQVHAMSPRLLRPTPEQSQQAMAFIAKVKNEFMTKKLPTMKCHSVAENQRNDYVRALEQASHFAQDIDPKLPMYFYVLGDIEMIQKLVAIICTTREQRNLILNTPPKYILHFNTLSTLITQVQEANLRFNHAMNALNSQALSAPHTNNVQPPSNGSQQRPPVTQQSLQPVQTTPSLPHQSVPPPSVSRSVNLNQPPASKKKSQQPQVNAVVMNAAASSPTPPASTPAAVTPAATPAAAAASPKTPKSPKGKTVVKTKAPSTKRKSSKAIQPAPEPAQPTAPSPAGSLKRPRDGEEATADSPTASNAPSPKKPKTEPEGEGPPNDELVKKEQQIDNIKTEEDASAFLEQMTEFFRLAAGNDQESLKLDISEALETILKSCGQDNVDGTSSSMAPLGFGNTLGLQDPSSPPNSADEFHDFVDYTSCAADDGDPTTPDLVSSSSTNPSPGSASDPTDAGHNNTTGVLSDNPHSVKLEVADDGDIFRLGGWKEIDGGQSVYYQVNNSAWDTPMVAQEQSWAVGS